MMKTQFSEIEAIADTGRSRKTFVVNRTDQMYTDKHSGASNKFPYDDILDYAFTWLNYNNTDVLSAYNIGSQIGAPILTSQSIKHETFLVFYNPIKNLMLLTEFCTNAQKDNNGHKITMSSGCFKPYGQNAEFDSIKLWMLTIFIFKVIMYLLMLYYVFIKVYLELLFYDCWISMKHCCKKIFCCSKDNKKTKSRDPRDIEHKQTYLDMSLSLLKQSKKENDASNLVSKD